MDVPVTIVHSFPFVVMLDCAIFSLWEATQHRHHCHKSEAATALLFTEAARKGGFLIVHTLSTGSRIDHA